MTAQYLVRIDDLCPTSNWDSWERVEATLRAYDVRPLIAVVPDNQDPTLVAGPADDRFWDRVRTWQAAGWAIGLHGYQHRYETSDAGLVGLRAKSEFAGLDSAAQGAKLDAALAIFATEGVRPDAWVAPGHTFDRTTVRLLLGRGVDVVSDGFHTRAATDGYGAVWVPQQLWRFRRRARGLWSVCYHVNRWKDEDHARLEDDLRRFQGQVIDLSQAVADGRRRQLSSTDAATAATNRLRTRTRQHAAVLLRR